MTNLSLRDRRHQQATKDFARLERQRAETLDKLARITENLKTVRRSIERYERTPKPTAVTPTAPANVEPPTPPQTPPAPVSAVIDEAIPGFLKRTATKAPDDIAAVLAIEAERANKRIAKSRARVEKLKAKQAGDLKKMPLTGRAAMEKIRAG